MKRILISFISCLFYTSVFSSNEEDFVTKWDLAKYANSHSSISFDVLTSGTVNYTWEEIGGGLSTGSGQFSGNTSIFSSIAISGLPTNAKIILRIEHVNFRAMMSKDSKQQLIDVMQWGSTQWSMTQWMFWYCINLDITASDKPNLSNVTNMYNMFSNCAILTGPSNINSWDVSNVNNMEGLFIGCGNFNQPISNWNVSNVTNMSNMFLKAAVFNQPLNNWNTSSLQSLASTFQEAYAFNQPLNNWNTSNVTDMRGVFAGAYAFNQPLNNWNTSNVTVMEGIFNSATSFNQNIGGWNISKVKSLQPWYPISFNNTALSVSNYDSLIIGWSSQITNNSVYISANGLKYCNSSTQRSYLITVKQWNISGDVLNCLTPISLTSFTATPSQSKVLLQWQTATETNNNFFTVQRSSNKDNWQNIATLKGAGNSNVVKEYSSTDNNPLQGTSYYRIKQTDFNGSYSYSELRSVELGIRNLGISIYPNPAKDFVNITTNQSLWLSVYDMFGKTVLTQKLNAGDNRVNTNNLSSGLYLVEAKGINTAYTNKLLITQ